MSQPSFRMPDAVPVEGLGITSDEVVWLGRLAADSLLSEAERAGLKPGVGSDVITLSPGALATAEAISTFVAATQNIDGDVVGTLAGDVGAWGRWSAFGPPALLVRLRGGGVCTADRIAAARAIEVAVADPKTIQVPLADRPGGRIVELTLADEVLVSTHHHAGVLWANLLAMPPALWRNLMGTNPVVAMFRGMLGWMRTRSTDPFVVAGALNRIERGARVHPSAVVEGAWIGEGATVGPGAVVRGSIIGPGANVEPMALVAFSVLGPSSHVQRMGWCHFSVLHPDSAHAGAMQMGVLGPGASTKGVSVLMDQGASGPVRVRRGGELHDVPLGLMGVGLGRNTMVGSGVLVAPGRIVPPGLKVLPSEGSVLMRIPEGIEGVVRVNGSTVEPT